MATIAVIREQDDGALDEIEQLRIAEIIEYPASGTVFDELLEKIAALTPQKNQLARAYMLDFEEIGDGTLKLDGGDEGTDYDQERDRIDLRNKVLRLLSLPLPDALEDDSISAGLIRVGNIYG